MNSYIIFIKDNESKVLKVNNVTREHSKELKSKGFTKYPYTIEANNEKDAIAKLNKQGEEHLYDLSQFSGNIFFYCAILVAGLVIAFIFSR
ncbi:hypothetical protein [Kosakonia oryziphila]|jgi:hypothetical protein|uniref:Uncharacterized protein n=1 Tax=Kosakonia oryziphila TaxID=1005667 RepID=A0A1C4GPI1_9ENTR|nr:hypothetical protein [Kosakonia oryziphila]SCC70066.1 hypothetical protein GA0061070_11103 [Kosakonia oryziphila]